MLMLTPAAEAAVGTVLGRGDLPDGASLRLQRGTDNAGGPAIGITVVTEPEAGDQVVASTGGGDVLVASEVVEVLDDQVLDAELRDENVAFRLRPQKPGDEEPAAAS
jgi:Fe-S cluster assembly iron-binding protein IscA